MFYISNKSRLSTDGLYRIKTITIEQARHLVLHEEKTFISMVNNQISADILTLLLETTVTVDTSPRDILVGDSILVFRAGRRMPEGQLLLIDDIGHSGYKLQLIKRIE